MKLPVIKERYRLRKMAEMVKKAKSVLDIGCVDQPNNFLHNELVIGLDIAFSQLPGNYDDLIVGNAMELPAKFEPNSFDSIVCGEVVEHMERPLDFLKCCKATLNKHGILVFSTPNPNSPYERILTITLSTKFFYTSDHVCIYPQRWLIRMCKLAGFTSVEIHSGGISLPLLGNIPFPRPWCQYSIVKAVK